MQNTVKKSKQKNERKLFISQFSVAGMLFIFLSLIPDIYYQVWDTMIYSFVSILIFGLLFIFNKKYDYAWIGLLAVFIFSFMLFIISKVVGYYSRATLFYIPLTITVPLFINYQDKALFYTGLFFPIALGIAADNLNCPFIPTSPDMTMEKQEVYGKVNFILSLLLSPFLAFKVVDFHYQQSKLLKQSQEELTQKNKELIKINQELDRFIYSLSHDLRSPVASAIGLTLLAKDETDAEQLKTYFAMQEQGLKRLDSFIQEVLNYAKNNHQEIIIKQVNIKEIVDDILFYLMQNPEYQKIVLITDITQETSFFSDAFRIKVILQNLIANAFRYHDKNKTENNIKVSFRCNTEKAYLEVWDNGIGIPETYHNRIFEMFFRGNTHTKGTGLGLYIVKDALDKLNGEISLISKEKEYTRFSVTVPNLIKP